MFALIWKRRQLGEDMTSLQEVKWVTGQPGFPTPSVHILGHHASRHPASSGGFWHLMLDFSGLNPRREAFRQRQRTGAAVDLLVVLNRIRRHGSGPTRHQDWGQVTLLLLNRHHLGMNVRIQNLVPGLGS